MAIAFLAYISVMSIVTPIRFSQERAAREKVIIENLINIRKAQIEFNKQNARYLADCDSLINFILHDSLPIMLKEGTLTDEQMKEGLTEKKVVEYLSNRKKYKKEIAEFGIENFRRETSFVTVKESLFPTMDEKQVRDMMVVPFSNGKRFEMETSTHTNATSGIPIPLFEARAPFDFYLSDLNHQELVNLKDERTKLEKYCGLMVGSISEPNNNAGNWE